MNAAMNLVWALVSVLGAVALADVAGLVHPLEKLNGLWLMVAAVCIYVGGLSVLYPSACWRDRPSL